MPYHAQTDLPGGAAQAGLQAAAAARQAGLRQEDIANVLGVNQSQISRIFRGKVRRPTDTLMRVCKYVSERSLKIHPDEVRRNETLMQALAEVWDGSEHDAQILANILRSLGTLRKPSVR